VKEFGYRKPRFHADFRLLMQIEGPQSRLLDARCRDMSEDGLAAQLADQLSVGTRVNFIFTLPSPATSLRIAAKVSNRNEQTHGFTFIYSSQQERDFIHEFLLYLGLDTVRLTRPPQPGPDPH
jgi:hypothetical protein